ncbi:MAG: cbb3-type cytochrome c oxidase subunit 3 [Candidatus Macondimonas sp.]|jgi:cbb3-type cytochrome oxidase subunit 3
MDTGTLMGLITLVLMLVFVGIVVWTFLLHRPADFERTARLPLQEDDPIDRPATRKRP